MTHLSRPISDTLRSGQFWAGAVDGYLLSWALFGWAWVLIWLYFAITLSAWNTVPAVLAAVAWAVLAQQYFGRR